MLVGLLVDKLGIETGPLAALGIRASRFRAAASRPRPHSLLALAPIGCWSAGLVLDVASRFSADHGALVRTATWLVGIGLSSAVVAGVAGMVQAAPVPMSVLGVLVLGATAWTGRAVRRERGSCSRRPVVDGRAVPDR